MTDDNLGQQLHDKATRGIALSETEQADLEAWYAQKDAEEMKLLEANSPPDLAALQKQLDESLAQLQTATQRIQTLSKENEAVRRDIASLYRQLSQKTPVHTT